METKENNFSILMYVVLFIVGTWFIAFLVLDKKRKDDLLMQKINEQEKIAIALDSFSKVLDKSVYSLNKSVDSLLIKSNKMKDETNKLFGNINKLESLNK